MSELKTIINHPSLRKQTLCPICKGFKDLKLICYWECYHKHGLRYRNKAIDRVLDEAEIELNNRN